MPVTTLTLRDPQHQVTYVNEQGRTVTVPRDVILSAYVPAQPGTYPVIIYSHGHASGSLNSVDAITAQALADRGYIVVMPNHLDSAANYPVWMTNQFLLHTPASGLHRAADIQFALDQAQTVVNGLPGYVADVSAPVVAGFSHGAFAAGLIVGMTTERPGYVVTRGNIYGLDSVEDPRFVAAILLSPQGDISTWANLSPSAFAGVDVPLLIITGTADDEYAGAPWTDRLDAFRYDLSDDVHAVVYRDATHADIGGYSVIPGLTASLTGLIDAFLDGQVRGDAAALARFADLAALMRDEPLLAQAYARMVTGSVGTGFLMGTDSGDDTLNGLNSNDIMLGRAGADVLTGGRGADTLSGGAGADRFRYLAVSDSNGSGSDFITDFQSGLDTIDLTVITTSQIALVRQGGGTFVFAATTMGTLQLAAVGDVNGTDILGLTRGVQMFGDGAAADRMVGSLYGDQIEGGGGDDILTGGRGADALSGGAGADTFRYVAATDSVAGSSDNLVDFQTGLDRIDLTGVGATQISIVRSGTSSFLFVNTAAGQSMQITAAGRAINGSDLIQPSGLGVYMVGDAIGETLTGSGLGDAIDGRGGNDILVGGGGADALFGGAGADVFAYRSASDSTAAAFDIVQDFAIGLDRIDLTGVRMGAADRYGIAYVGGGSFLFVDLGGDGINDMMIAFSNATITGSDVIW